MGWNAFSFVFVNSSQGFTDSSPYSVKQACLFEFYVGWGHLPSEVILELEVKKYIFEKLVKNCLESPILVFLISCH